jgi:thiamine-phosphate pyrophosphorylase
MGGFRPHWCLVTDRNRLAPDRPFDASRKQLVEQARWASSSGIDLIQVRERDLPAAPLARLVEDLLAVCHGSGTRVVVNDRADVALACGADGVHLRHDSVAAESVRAIAPPGFIIGRSVHGVDEAASAGPVDYLIAGTVFPTASKPGAGSTIGVDGLTRIVHAVTVPVLGIGGISAESLDAIAAAGAAGVAGIGLFIRWFDRHEAPS